MAQKRNPISLRLQTRLKGHEKRFASCWFTDLFFPQAYTNDLAKRLYIGNLLEKGGNWCNERSEADIPETCVSIQFLYRKSCVLSVLLDKRKQEYLLSTSSKSISSRQENKSGSFQQEDKRVRVENQGSVSNPPVATNSENALVSMEAIKKERDSLLESKMDTLQNDGNEIFDLQNSVEKNGFNPIRVSPETRVADLDRKAEYFSIADSFATVLSTRTCRTNKWSDVHTFPTGLEKTRRAINSSTVSKRHFAAQKEWKGWLYCTMSSQYCVAPDLLSISTIESICTISSQKRDVEREQKNSCVIHTKDLKKTPLIALKGNRPMVPLNQSLHWTSLKFIRATSVFQSVEFCLCSVAFLYKKRLSFTVIKDTFFKMLEASGTIRGARLVCSGRQGGRSKSAMRAKKQSAVWGQSALSLFSSRLAFAGTSVDTSFGQVGIKVWICYK